MIPGGVTCLRSAELVSLSPCFQFPSFSQSAEVAQENQIQLTGLIAIKLLLESGLCSLVLGRN